METESSLPCSQELPQLIPILSQDNPVHTTPSYLSNIYLISSTHLPLVLPSGYFPSVFPTNFLYEFLFSPIRAFGRLSKESVQVLGPLWHFVTTLFFTVRSC
jgi:hypothetical protein